MELTRSLGKKALRPIDSAEIQLSLESPQIGPHIEFEALKPLGVVERAEGLGRGVEAGEASVGAQPELALFTGQDTVDDIIG